MNRKILILLVVATLQFTCLYSQINSERVPKFDASIKTKYEYALETKMSRFSVRNTRMGLTGNISDPVSYRVQAELSSAGKFEVLDLSGTVTLFDGFSLTLGQTSVPIFNSYIVTPSTMLFANRAFIGKYFAGTRDIGAVAVYRTQYDGTPITFEAGIFNGSTINSPVWTNRLSYASRVQMGGMTGWRTTAKIYRYPFNEVRDYFFWGADVRYAQARFKAEAEVMNRHNYYNGVNRLSFYIQSAYSFPVAGSDIIKNIRPALRWDAIGENLGSNKLDANRLTFGLAFGFTERPFGSLIRLDYEHYFVSNPIYEFDRYDEMDSNKFTIELLILF